MQRKPHLWVMLVILLLAAVYDYYEPDPHRENHHRRHHEESPYYTESSKRENSNEYSSTPPVIPPGVIDEYGMPIFEHRLTVLKNMGYIVGYDTSIEDPRWDETRFFAVQNPSSQARPSEFSPDTRLPYSDQMTTQMWSNSGYDRGHMTPNEGEAFCYGREGQLQTFLLTNVIPQSPNLNRGLWETLEKIISHDYAERFGQVWVICGPIFDQNPPRYLYGNKIAIPTRCYKIVLKVQNGQPSALAFEMPQDIEMGHRQSDLLQYLTSISHIEQDTHIKFFPDLADATRQQLESYQATRLW